jgi:hypothetical protein
MFNDGRLLSFGRDTHCGCVEEGGETVRGYDLRTRRYYRIPNDTVPRPDLVHQTRLYDTALLFDDTGAKLRGTNLEVQAQGSGSFPVPNLILGSGDRPERLMLYPSYLVTLGAEEFVGETAFVSGEEPVMMSHDDRRAYYFHRSSKGLHVRDMATPGFPLLRSAGGLPYEYWPGGIESHDDTHVYVWSTPMISIDVR